jgi:hypothetical protein
LKTFLIDPSGDKILDKRDLSPDNLDENGGGNQTVKRRPVATL